MTPEEKKIAFLEDIGVVMKKHAMKNLLMIYSIDEEIRNSYLFTGEENELYSRMSDGIDAWMKQGIEN